MRCLSPIQCDKIYWIFIRVHVWMYVWLFVSNFILLIFYVIIFSLSFYAFFDCFNDRHAYWIYALNYVYIFAYNMSFMCLIYVPVACMLILWCCCLVGDDLIKILTPANTTSHIIEIQYLCQMTRKLFFKKKKLTVKNITSLVLLS